MQTLTFLRRVIAGIILPFIFTAPMVSYAGGVALGSTRVIYPADAKQVSLAITNSDENTRFLIQSWVEDANEKKTTDFILTPPLFVSKPKGENTLRIMYVGGELPKDRESVYWLNSKAIPAVERDAIQGKNVLQIAILSRIKLFVRPVGLPSKPIDAPGQLQFKRQGDSLVITNPSPYYVTLVSLNIGAHKLPNTMISPKSNAAVQLPAGSSGTVTYQTVNDYGANTPTATAVVK
ncbi:Chaperone protein fimC precursor [Serratia fonticola]|nr:Chaperone protein fimC precursor [Serratia fonticola]